MLLFANIRNLFKSESKSFNKKSVSLKYLNYINLLYYLLVLTLKNAKAIKEIESYINIRLLFALI